MGEVVPTLTPHTPHLYDCTDDRGGRHYALHDAEGPSERPGWWRYRCRWCSSLDEYPIEPPNVTKAKPVVVPPSFGDANAGELSQILEAGDPGGRW